MMRRLFAVLAVLAAESLCAAPSATSGVRRADFRIRDPFVLVDGGRYYLYESKPWFGGRGVAVRESADLECWSEATPVLTLPSEMDCTAVWAPEVHRYNGAYWLFVTLTQSTNAFRVAALSPDADPKNLTPRGTWVFRADSPRGPFRAVKDGSVPPRELMTLDGTLHVEDGRPYMVYCHEWCQLANGTIEYAPLTDDLSAFASAPRRLLDARSAMEGAARVTDGCFLYRSEKSGRLYLIWSNFIEGHGYCVLVRSSVNGRLAGPWTKDEILYGENGGHGMIFRGLDGELYLTFHGPEKPEQERMRLVRLEDDGQQLRVRSPFREADPLRSAEAAPDAVGCPLGRVSAPVVVATPPTSVVRYPWKRQELRQLLALNGRRRWVAAFSDVRCENDACYRAALELPDGKVLLAYGQSVVSRRMVVFDPDWLCETSRKEDFRHGFENVSNHLYVKSLTGGWKGFAGHCAWNRVPGALLVRDPETDAQTRREVLQLARPRRPRAAGRRLARGDGGLGLCGRHGRPLH